LRDGFAGELAVTAPRLALANCELNGATLYGSLTVKGERPGFAARLGVNRLAAFGGEGEFTWRDGGLTARYDLAGTGLDTPAARAARIGIDGSLRTRRDFRRIELDAQLAGQKVRPGAAVDDALAAAEKSARDTLLGPLLARMRGALAAGSRASAFTAEA